MMIARPKLRAVNGSAAFSMAPSRTCRCQSSGLRRVMRSMGSAYPHLPRFVSVARRVRDHRAGQVRDALEAASRAPFLEPVDEGDHRGGIAEVEIADLDRARAGEQVLDDILDLHDPAAAD